MVENDKKPTFSNAEYERRWNTIAERVREQGLDAVAVTGPINVPYLAGYDDDGVWPSPVIVTADGDVAFVVRNYDADTIRVESRISRIVPFFGDDDHIQVWADTVRELGVDRGRLGVDLETYGAAPADISELQRHLPNVTIEDATKLITRVSAVKSDEEIAVMRQAMAFTRIGIEAFHNGIHEGADELDVYRQMEEAMESAGSERRYFWLLFGNRTALPHGESAHNRIESGDVAFTEVGGRWQGYSAGLCRTALLGSNQPAEDLYKLAQEANDAAIEVIRPGVTTGEIDRACRGVVERAGRSETFRHRAGYVIGLGWSSRGNISIHPSGTDVVEQGMTLHLPTNLFQQGEFGVGVSETVLVTADGAETLSRLSRDLAKL